MKKQISRILLAGLFLFGLAGVLNAQTTPTYTTLTSALTGGGNTPGSGLGIQPVNATVTLASVSNINAFGAATTGLQGFNPSGAIRYNTYLLIDRELMAVQTVNSTTKQAVVLRGWQGTAVNPHANGAVVIAALPEAFASIDPTGQCTGALTLVSPVIVIGGSAPNVGNFGRQWVCDSTSGNWMPGLSTGAITPVATGAVVGTPSNQTFTLNGVVTGDPIIVEAQPSPTALCPLQLARATATNTVTLTWYPLTAAACTPAAGTYIFFDAVRY